MSLIQLELTLAPILSLDLNKKSPEKILTSHILFLYVAHFVARCHNYFEVVIPLQKQVSHTGNSNDLRHTFASSWEKFSQVARETFISLTQEAIIHFDQLPVW